MGTEEWTHSLSQNDNALQRDLDLWLKEYNELRPHQGAGVTARPRQQTFIDAAPLAREKMLDGTQEGLA